MDILNSRSSSLVLSLSAILGLVSCQNLFTLGNVVGTTKQGIDLLQCNLLGLRNKEENEETQQEVDASKEIECVESIIVKEDGEELLENGVCDVLGLRCHSDGLGADIHREDLGCPNPYCCTPRRLVYGLLVEEFNEGSYRKILTKQDEEEE